MIFGLVLGRLAALKILDRAIKYATFEGNVFMGNCFLNIVASA